MKLSLAVLSLAFASVQGSSLRLQKAVASNNNGKLLDSEVILKGTIGEPTAEDMEFIGKALVASYNDVHWEAGHYMTGPTPLISRGPTASCAATAPTTIPWEETRLLPPASLRSRPPLASCAATVPTMMPWASTRS